MEVRFIDLFAGIGGFHQGFTKAGYRCVMASEIDHYCREIYTENYNMVPRGDIASISSDEVPPHEVLVAGFPCQPFSICGHKKGFNDIRGTLFFDICRIAAEGGVETLVLENVKHLIHHDGGNTFKVILGTLEKMGYAVSHALLNAVNFGVPQNRERVIIIASKKGHFDFSSLSNRIVPRKKMREFLEPENDSMEYLDPSEYTLLDKFTFQAKSGLIFVGYRNKRTRIAGTRPNTEHLSRVHKQPNRIYSVEGTHPTLPALETSGRFFIYFPETKRVRKLTIKECYRIMGFSDNFIISKNKTEAYKQVGNSVCVSMAKAIAEEIKRQFFSEAETRNAENNTEMYRCLKFISPEQLQLI